MPEAGAACRSLSFQSLDLGFGTHSAVGYFPVSLGLYKSIHSNHYSFNTCILYLFQLLVGQKIERKRPVTGVKKILNFPEVYCLF